MTKRIPLSIGLGLIGFVLCFVLPHIHSPQDLVIHLAAAAAVVVALAINMADEETRRRNG